MCPIEDATAECPPETEREGDSGCLLDTDCTGDQKCCSDGCTLGCVDPAVTPTVITVKGEPGERGEKGKPVSIFFYQLVIHFLTAISKSA